MRIIYKLLIFATVMLALSGIVNGQTVIGTGAVNQLTYQKGGDGADSVMGMPVRDTFCNNFPAFRCAGRMTVQPGTFNVYVNTGTYWKQVGALSIPNLQQVTDAGNTTTNSITASGLISTGDIQAGSSVFTEDIYVNGEIVYQNAPTGEGNILILNGSDVVKQSSISTASLLTDTIFISQIPGIHQNSNLYTGGGTSDAALIQPVLNLASASNPLVLIQDGVSLIDTTLLIKSNTTFITLQGAGFFLDSGARDLMFLNYGGYAGNNGIVDSNISIIGGFFNGNGANQIDPVNAAVMPNGYAIHCLQFMGVKNLVMKDFTTTKGGNWGLALVNVKDFYISGHRHLMDWIGDTSRYTVGQFVAGQIRLSQDGVSFRGGCERGVYENAWLSSSDDVASVNNIRYLTDPVGLNHDPIIDLTLRNIILDSAALGVSIYSDSSLVDRILLDGLTGTSQYRPLYIGSGSASGSVATNVGGNTGSVTIKNVNVEKINPKPRTFGYNIPSFFDIDGNVTTLLIDNYIADKQYGTISDLRQLSGTVRSFTVTNYSRTDTRDTAFTLPRFLFSGTIHNLRISGATWRRNNNLTRRGKFMSADYVIRSTLSDMRLFYIDTAFRYASPSTISVAVSNVLMDSCSSTGLLIDAANGSQLFDLHTAGVFTGSTPMLGGAGASNLINNGKVKSANFGIHDWYVSNGSSTSTTVRGIRFTSGNTFLVGDGGGYTLTDGLLTPDRTTVMGGVHYNGTNTTLNTIRLGTSTASYAIGIVPATNAVDMPGTLSVTGNTTVTTGTFQVTSGVSNLLNSAVIRSAAGSDAVLTLQRPTSTVNAATSIYSQMFNSNNSGFVNYGGIGISIVNNTAGSHTGLMNFALTSSGTIANKMTLHGSGNLVIGGTLVDNGYRLDVGGIAILRGLTSFASKINSYNNTPPTDGQLLIGHTANSTFEKATLTQGTGISITNGAGAITIAGNNAETLTTTGAGTLTLSTSSNYIFTGTTTTWTLPVAGSNAGVVYKLKNKGSGDITLVTTGAANEIYTTVATNTYTITPGSAIILVCDGSHFNVE